MILGDILYFTVLGDSHGIVRGLPDQSASCPKEMEIVLKYVWMEMIFIFVMDSSLMSQLVVAIQNQWWDHLGTAHEWCRQV